MEQGRAVNKILRDMKQFELISKDATGEVRSGEARVFLNALYVAGWEGAKHDTNNNCEKPVIQFDRTGKRITKYPSVTIAAKELKCTRDGLYKAIRKGTPTKKGYIWIYET